MQRKIGIRLRHLQTQPDNNQRFVQNIIPIDRQQQQPVGRKDKHERQRSQSPLNRRKIFNKNLDEFSVNNHKNEQQPSEKVYQIKSQIMQTHHQYEPPVSIRPQQISNNEWSTSQNFDSNFINKNSNPKNMKIAKQYNQYESQVERLIESLKKKTLQLQKKDEIIAELKNQLQLAQAQNKTNIQQIKTLKAQLQFQKASNSNKMFNGNEHNGQPIYQSQRVSGNDQKYLKNVNNQNNFQHSNYKNNNQQVIHVKINPNRLQQKSQNTKINRNNMSKEQDSILSDYLSPLMVLGNNESSSNRSGSPLNSQIYEKNNRDANKSKTNSRVSYQSSNMNNKTKSRISYQSSMNNNKDQDQFAYKTSPNGFNSFKAGYSATIKENPFAKKQYTQFQTSKSRNKQRQKAQLQNFNIFAQPAYNKNHYEYQSKQGKKWSTLQSSAPHFNNPNILNQSLNSNYGSPFGGYNNRGIGIQSKQIDRPKLKELSIEDSKHFKFQDFDFSELQSQVGHSKI